MITISLRMTIGALCDRERGLAVASYEKGYLAIPALHSTAVGGRLCLSHFAL